MKVKSKLPSILSKVKHKTKVVVASALVASLIPFWVFDVIGEHSPHNGCLKYIGDDYDWVYLQKRQYWSNLRH